MTRWTEDDLRKYLEKGVGKHVQRPEMERVSKMRHHVTERDLDELFARGGNIAPDSPTKRIAGSEDRDTRPAADVESIAGDESLGPWPHPPITTPVRLAFHSVRKRLADLDNLSTKATTDGLVTCGVLADDNPQIVVRSTECTQEKAAKGEPEKTIISVYHVKEEINAEVC
ncbi:MAG: hypothetical protein IH951_11645 [Bacteroidetes bacterium]|nr:hypothetical protein [Bacteroidota bacterium]